MNEGITKEIQTTKNVFDTEKMSEGDFIIFEDKEEVIDGVYIGVIRRVSESSLGVYYIDTALDNFRTVRYKSIGINSVINKRVNILELIDVNKFLKEPVEQEGEEQIFCPVDYFECKEWLNGARCKAKIEKRNPVECFELVNNKIKRKE